MKPDRGRPHYLAWGIVALCLAGLVVLRLGRDRAAGHFPERPITIVCPYAAGGGTDLFARGLARAAEKRLGQTVIVSNVTGGAGAVGHAAVLGVTLTFVR